MPESFRHSALDDDVRVSVVVPTFNRAHDIGRCLDSLVAQTFGDFEVLVCDDGSTDNTAEVVNRYRDRLRLTYEWGENFGGAARPRNTGLRLARGEFVAFLDSDDWWCPEKLAESVRALDAGADLVYHDLFVVRSASQRSFRRKQRTVSIRRPAFEVLLYEGNVITNSSVVVRTELIRRSGGFSEDRALIACEDYDAWLRVAQNSERLLRIDRTLGYYWLGGGNISSPRRALLNLERLYELYFAPVSERAARKTPAWYHYMRGLAYYDLGAYGLALGQMQQALGRGMPFLQSLKAMQKACASLCYLAIGRRAVTAP